MRPQALGLSLHGSAAITLEIGSRFFVERSHKEPFACESTEADGSFSVKVNLFAVFKYG